MIGPRRRRLRRGFCVFRASSGQALPFTRMPQRRMHSGVSKCPPHLLFSLILIAARSTRLGLMPRCRPQGRQAMRCSGPIFLQWVSIRSRGGTITPIGRRTHPLIRSRRRNNLPPRVRWRRMCRPRLPRSGRPTGSSFTFRSGGFRHQRS